MWSLYIDTHYKNIVLVLYHNKELHAITNQEVNKDHSVFIMPMLESILKQNNLTVHDLKEIYVCVGPGSFTGIRLAVTIAKTLAYTLNIPIKTINSLEVSSLGNTYEYLAVEENNGAFLAKRENLSVIKYYPNEEYHKLKETAKCYINDNPNYELIPTYLENAPAVNPHSIKPLYIKGISALNEN